MDLRGLQYGRMGGAVGTSCQQVQWEHPSPCLPILIHRRLCQLWTGVGVGAVFPALSTPCFRRPRDLACCRRRTGRRVQEQPPGFPKAAACGTGGWKGARRDRISLVGRALLGPGWGTQPVGQWDGGMWPGQRGQQSAECRGPGGGRGHVGLLPGCPAGVTPPTSPQPTLPCPPGPAHPSLDPGPEALCLISRVHMWRPEPLPGQTHTCTGGFQFSLRIRFSFQPKQLPPANQG